MPDGLHWIIDYRAQLLGSDRSNYLSNARKWLGGGYREHNRVAALLRNVESFASSMECATINVVGHGQRGAIGAGCGDTISDPEYYLGEDGVMDFVTVKRRVGVFVLWGCDVGAGPEGLGLLVSLSKATGAICMAPTGLVCCCPDRGFWVIENAPWQIAFPFGAEPSAIPLPKYSPTSTGNWTLLDTEGKPLSRSRIEDVTLYTRSKEHARRALDSMDFVAPLDGTCALIEDATLSRCSKDHARRALDSIDFVAPIEGKCALGAFKTGRMEIQVVDEGPMSFTVYNDRVIQCDTTGKVFGAARSLSSPA